MINRIRELHHANRETVSGYIVWEPMTKHDAIDAIDNARTLMQNDDLPNDYTVDVWTIDGAFHRVTDGDTFAKREVVAVFEDNGGAWMIWIGSRASDQVLSDINSVIDDYVSNCLDDQDDEPGESNDNERGTTMKRQNVGVAGIFGGKDILERGSVPRNGGELVEAWQLYHVASRQQVEIARCVDGQISFYDDAFIHWDAAKRELAKTRIDAAIKAGADYYVYDQSYAEKPKPTKTSAYLDDELLARLRTASFETRKSQSEIICDALREYLDHN